MNNMNNKADLGLYIHIPFCLKKCAYCDFTSFCDKNDYIEDYFECLKSEIMSHEKNSVIDTVFFGGGTPSSVDEKYIYDILRLCNEHFDMSKCSEISIEVNPATVTKEKLFAYKNAGINRISMGAQAFVDDELKSLGRVHLSNDIIESYKLIRECGFENVSLDLMFGIPNQTNDSFAYSLEQAIKLNPEHISAYSLIVEEGTAFYDLYNTGMLKLASEDDERIMYDYLIDFLKDYGYNQYEISNFSKPGYECKHNLKYWHTEPYIGIGTSASGYDGEVRYTNTSNLDKYIDNIKNNESVREDSLTLTAEDRVSEYIIMNLRLNEGLNLEEFKKCFGFDFSEKYADIIKKYINLELLKQNSNSISFTRKGFSVSNSVLYEFV